MAYGRFDDAAREYVVARPDTPLPWLNYLGGDDLVGLCTNTGGGYTFWRDARLRRLTRYRYNDVPLDAVGRYLYVNDGGTVWNPGWKPTKTPLDRYECRHGLGYTRILGARDGVEVELLFFVPPGEDVEVWRTTVRNAGAVRKELRLFSYVEFCLFDALADQSNYQRTYSIGEVEVEGPVIRHVTGRRERRDHYALFACTREVAGFDTARDAFAGGPHRGLHEAAVPLAGRATGSVAHGWNPVGSHQVDLALEPGAEETFAFLLAYVRDGEPEPVARFADPVAVDAAFEALRRRWDELLSRLRVETPEPRLDRMLDCWSPAQCATTFALARSASLYETGIDRGIGFRDANQDLLGFVHLAPERARRRLLDLAATQLPDGSCFHQYQPLTGEGNADIGSGFNDDPLWLVVAACAYVRETGDVAVLAEGDLLGHLESSIAYTLARLGPHGLPLIGHADWNDCLNLSSFSTDPDESFQTAGDVEGSTAESAMIAGLFCFAAGELAALYRHLGRAADAERLEAERARMLAALEEHAWDGDWYLRAFDAAGRPVGSHTCEEGRIFVESNAWAVLGGAGEARSRQALESVEAQLGTPDGVLLHQPAYTRYRPELGEITSYPPGYKENAGVFCHTNPWVTLAWCRLGEGERALASHLAILPDAKDPDVYRGEPYVYAQVVAGRDAATPGEARNTWLTGTAAWALVGATQGILGVRPDYDGLRVDPCVPRDWRSFRVTRRFRGATYEIAVANPDGVCRGVRSLRVDGVEAPGTLVPVAPAGAHVRVEVVLGGLEPASGGTSGRARTAVGLG